MSVRLSDTGTRGSAFRAELAASNGDWRKAFQAHSIVAGIHGPRDISIGQRGQSAHAWDGLIQRLRLHAGAIDTHQLLDWDDRSSAGGGATDSLAELTSSQPLESAAVDLAFTSAEAVIAASDASLSIVWPDAELRTPQHHARVALVHALLNSNEMIYLD